MRIALLAAAAVAFFPYCCAGRESQADSAATGKTGMVIARSDGLHGYIGFDAGRPSARSEYSAGMGFYSAVWQLVDKPIADFQIGLASAWITPDNSDNKDKPLAPEGTVARNWKERGPTWASVFQTVEGGLGYWAGNHFRYGPPKFSMNATPQCYDFEVGSPGWSFFSDDKALPDNRLGIAQLSNRLLIPPDALPFQGNPNGEFLGYAYMALPFTEPTTGDPPTGDQAWTCFLSAANFKGPIAYYIPDTWSKVGKIFNYRFIYGRGLDAPPGTWAAARWRSTPCRVSTRPTQTASSTPRFPGCGSLWTSREGRCWCRTSPTTRRRRFTTPSKPGATAVPRAAVGLMKRGRGDPNSRPIRPDTIRPASH